jgi:hypothetical protein
MTAHIRACEAHSSCLESHVQRRTTPTTQHVSNVDVAVEFPPSPPVLTPGAARALVRVLLKAGRSRLIGSDHCDGETDALAS